MWTAVQPASALAALWLVGITIGFLLSKERHVVALLGNSKHALLVILLVTLLVRLVPTLLLPVGATYDIESFRLVGEALLNGEDIYRSAAAGRHPYLPLQLYWIGFATWLSHTSVLPFVIWIKLQAVLADMCVVAVIFKAFRHWNAKPSTSAYFALLYAINPVPILVSGYHGQFDSIPVLLLLLAWYGWHFGRRLLRSALALGFAILSKSWPVVFLPVVFIRISTWRSRLVYSTISLAIPVLFTAGYLIIFDADPTPILRRSLTHAGVPGYWGLSTLIHIPGGLVFDSEGFLANLLPFQRYFLLAVGLFTLWWTRKQDALNALLTIILTIFAAMLGMGLQWLLWPVAFAVLAHETRWLKWYSVMGGIMMFVHLYGLHLYPWLRELLDSDASTIALRLASLPVWMVILLWAIRRLRGASKLSTEPGAN